MNTFLRNAYLIGPFLAIAAVAVMVFRTGEVCRPLAVGWFGQFCYSFVLYLICQRDSAGHVVLGGYEAIFPLFMGWLPGSVGVGLGLLLKWLVPKFRSAKHREQPASTVKT